MRTAVMVSLKLLSSETKSREPEGPNGLDTHSLSLTSPSPKFPPTPWIFYTSVKETLVLVSRILGPQIWLLSLSLSLPHLSLCVSVSVPLLPPPSLQPRLILLVFSP